MAITGTSTDYTGRSVDLYISGSLQPLSSNAQQVTYTFGDPSQFIAGVQKLVQRYVISLVNSGFIEQLVGTSNNNVSYAKSVFGAYNWSVVQTFKSYQVANPNPNLDEQLDTIQLLSVSTKSSDSVEFSLRLVTQAGTSVVFILPLPL